MKKKYDFVTNSSSTSFIVWGTSIEQDTLWENKNLVEQIYNNFKKSMYFPKELNLEEFHDRLFVEYSNEINEFFGTLDLETLVQDSNVLIGCPPETMTEDQTLAEFKNEIKTKLKDVGIEINKLNFITKTWYDG